MPKITKTKVGSVYLREVESRKWRASWTDPLTRRHVRRVLPAATFKDAQAQAQEINKQLAAGRGFGGRLRGAVGHTVSDAIIEAIQHTGANEYTRKDYLSRANGFIEYLDNHAKGVQAWGDVNEQIVENYIEHCRQQEMAHDTLRLRVYVLRLTSAYMGRTYRYRDITRGIRLRRQAVSRSEIEEKEATLTPAQLRNLLAWLHDNEPMVHVWGMLQGLCGLRMLESAFLRERDFDPIKRTITVTETGAHSPKNRASHREIPIPPCVARAVSEWIAGMRIRHEEGYLFFPSRVTAGRLNAKTRETRAGAYTKFRITKLWARAVDKAQESGLRLPPHFTPRRLRSGFVTRMREVGADFEVLQKYIGHAPGSVLASHYDKIGLERLSSVASLAEDLYQAKGHFSKVEKKRHTGR